MALSDLFLSLRSPSRKICESEATTPITIAPVNNIPNDEAEIFIIHGYDDETVPLQQGRALEAAGKKEKTHLWIVPGKGHSDCDTHPQFWEQVSTFLHRTLPIS